MDSRYFSDKIVEWYFEHKRDLPWRRTNDPYKVWLSEIILQQTRVNQGLPYYERFIETFPTIHELACASEQEVLRLWQGLGYYSRARNLHKCAKVVVSEYDGRFPDSYEDLLKLPGIGSYTAAAIASFSFKKAVAVLDGNVFRVLSRVFGVMDEIDGPSGKRTFTALANQVLNKLSPDHYNQAVMEFGALQCVPKSPPCTLCILKATCFAAQNELQTSLPHKSKRRSIRERHMYYLVVQNESGLMMRKRIEKDIWHGLYDFHCIENNGPLNEDSIVKQVNEWLGKTVQAKELSFSRKYKHILTHQVILATFILIRDGNLRQLKDKNLKFYTFERINDLPKPVLITRFLCDHKSFYS
jgi:A/G-specific adenine glycosylase